MTSSTSTESESLRGRAAFLADACDFKTVDQCGGSRSLFEVCTLPFGAAAVFVVMVCLFALWVAGTETTVATSSGQTFQITGTSVGGKVVTTKLPLPANSKIVTVNVPSSQGGMATFETARWRAHVTLTSV